MHLSFLNCTTTSKHQAEVFALFYCFCDRNKPHQQTSGQGFVHVGHRQTDRQTDRACSDLCDNIKVLYRSIIDTKQCKKRSGEASSSKWIRVRHPSGQHLGCLEMQLHGSSHVWLWRAVSTCHPPSTVMHDLSRSVGPPQKSHNYKMTTYV